MDTFGDDGEDDNDDDDKKAEEEEDLLAAGKMTTEDLARMIYYKPVFKKYSLKVELLGLRDIKNWMFNAVSNVRMEVDFPRVDQIALWNQDRYKEQDTRLVKSYAKGFHQGRTMNINESMEWEDVNVPMDNPNGLALRFRVYQATPIGEVLLGISHTHIVSGRIIDDLYKKGVKGPDFYQYVGYYDRRTLGDEDNENLGAEGEAGDAEGMEGKEKEEEEVVDDDDSSEEEEIAEMSPELKLAMANLKDVGIELTDPREAAATKKKQQEEAEKKGGEAAAAALAAMDEEEDKKKKKAVKYKGDLDEFGNPTLDVDGDQQEDRLNNQVLDTVAPSAKKKEETANNEGVAAADDDLAVKYDKDNKPYRLPMPIPVMSGKQVGYQSDQLRLLSVNSEIFWQQAALLKLFVTAVEYIYPPKPATMTDMDRERHNEARKKEDQRVREELKKANNIKWMEDNVLRVRYVSRLYVYEARHLSPRVGMFSPSETADPFLVVRNGLDPEETQNTRPVARVNSVNPEIQQVFELVTEFPKNNLLEVQVWNKDDIIGDDMIGQYTFDVEDLLVRAGGGTTFLPAKFYSLFTPTSVMTQGKLKMKLDILTEDESRRIRADEMQNADPLSYELRMVLWKTKDVRMPDEKDKDKDVDQKMFITTNFDGVYNGDTIKATDVAWFSAAGAAEWNWRMVYRFKLPCLVPRIKISMWDECVMTDSEAVGEVNYNLQPFFEQAIKDKKSVSNKPAQWIPFTHPNYPGITMGEVSVEFWLLTNIEADKQPVGEAQSEPNENPYLPMPHRNPPPWAVGSRMMDAMSGQRMLMIACALMMLLGAIAVPSVLLATKM